MSTLHAPAAGSAKDDPTTIAEVLAALAPPDGLALVGPGMGTSSWLDWLAHRRQSRVLLAEAHGTQFRRLQDWLDRHPAAPFLSDWVLRRTVVGRDDETVTFFEASLVGESGITRPSALAEHWPNLYAVNSAPQRTQSLDQLLASFGRCSWILVDCLPALPVLQGAPKRLREAEVMALRVARCGEAPGFDPQITLTLAEQGFRCVGLERVRHPRLARAWFVRDATKAMQAELDAAKARLQERERHCAELEIHAAQQEANLARLGVLVDEYRQQLVHAPADRVDASLRAQRAWLEFEQDRLHAATAEVSLNLDEQAECTQSRLAEAQCATTEALAQSVADQLARTIAPSVVQTFDLTSAHGLAQALSQAVVKPILHAVRRSQVHVESLMGIHQFLANGHGLELFHGWPISPGLGLQLLRCLQTERHDGVIEFGSGTSTVLLARALRVLGGRPEPASRRQILSFEHDPHYRGRTAALLDGQGLADDVDVRLAPLVELTLLERVSRFYDCEAALREFDAAAGAARRRLLVLVDGPPGPTAPLARLPALPLVLRHLGRHAIDLVLDDYGRAEEHEIVEIWRAWMRDEGFDCVEHQWDCDKGAIHLHIKKRESSA